MNNMLTMEVVKEAFNVNNLDGVFKMTRAKLSLEEVAEIVESEGLGYAIQDYLSHEEIAYHELALLWKDAQNIMLRIEEMLPEPSETEQ